MKKTILILFVTVSICSAQSAGKTGLSFLKNGFGARNIAMGDLGVTSANDVTALNYNPALLADYKYSQISVTHSEWIEDVRSEMLGASFYFLGLPFAVGLNTTSVSDIEIRTLPGESQSSFDANYFYASLSTAFYLIDDISFGLTYKYLHEDMLTDKATGYGFDFGVQYKTPIKGLNFGASYRNIGSMSELRNEATDLPADLRIGAQYNFETEQLNSDVILIGGFQKYTDTDDTHLHFGTEIFYDEILAIRAGYVTGYESKGLSAGLGLVWNVINFDYAFTPFKYSLGSAHTISVMYSFK